MWKYEDEDVRAQLLLSISGSVEPPKYSCDIFITFHFLAAHDNNGMFTRPSRLQPLKTKGIWLVQNKRCCQCWVTITGLHCAVIKHMKSLVTKKQKRLLLLDYQGDILYTLYTVSCLHCLQCKCLTHFQFPLQQFNMCKCVQRARVQTFVIMRWNEITLQNSDCDL